MFHRAMSNPAVVPRKPIAFVALLSNSLSNVTPIPLDAVLSLPFTSFRITELKKPIFVSVRASHIDLAA